ADGIPTFSYRLGDLDSGIIEVDDRITPRVDSAASADDGDGGHGLRRQLRIRIESQPSQRSAAASSAAICWLSSQSLSQLSDGQVTSQRGLTVTLPAAVAAASTIHDEGEQSSWLFPLSKLPKLHQETQ